VQNVAESDSPFKKIAEFFNNAKIIYECLLAFGAGTAVKAALTSLTKVPGQWIAPIWLASAAVSLWVISYFVERFGKKSGGDSGTQIQEAQKASSLAETGSSAEVDSFWKSYDNALLIAVEERVRTMADQCQAGTERERFLIRYIATREIVNYFEKVWSDILGSQIEALEALNPGGMRRESLEFYYTLAASAWTDQFSNFTYEKWIAFLTSQELISKGDGDIFSLTLFGREFLKYILSSGRSRQQKMY